MDYLWDVLIKAKTNGVNSKKITFELGERFSPYMELSDTYINFNSINNKVDINPYYRFYDIFKDLFDPTYEENMELRQVLLDILIHFLTRLDLKRGMDKKEFYKLFIYREIRNGSFGKEVQKGIEFFSIKEKNILLENILKLYITNNHMFCLKNTIKKIYTNSVVYINKLDENEVLVYLINQDSQKNINIIKAIENIFLPINFNMKVYWRFHFGVIGLQETMKINSISIY
ncbi:iron-dependent peroxidase [Natronospora cellulosivora (SeqCode)]